MPLLVDGDNLLGTWPGRSRSEADKRALAHALGRLARRLGRRVVVVFDGTAPESPASGTETLYAGPRRRADDVILDRLGRESEKRGWTVVTNDRSLADRCRWLGARVERCEAFRARLEDEPATEKPAADDDRAYWSRVFSDDGGAKGR